MNEIIHGWFSEIDPEEKGQAFSLKVEETLYHKRSRFQDIAVYRTASRGLALVLDGYVQLTERDEAAYHEMIAHLPSRARSGAKRALVIGGGDGGVLREIAKYDDLREIDVCEIDAEVIAVAKRFFPALAVGFDDPRVRVHLMDAAEFVKTRRDDYDVIVIDSSDPVGPAAALFETPFYRDLKTALKADGILCAQAESAFLCLPTVIGLTTIAAGLFRHVGYARVTTPMYPGGDIGFLLASDAWTLTRPVRPALESWLDKLKYYSPRVHEAAFVLPKFAEDALANVIRRQVK